MIKEENVSDLFVRELAIGCKDDFESIQLVVIFGAVHPALGIEALFEPEMAGGQIGECGEPGHAPYPLISGTNAVSVATPKFKKRILRSSSIRKILN